MLVKISITTKGCSFNRPYKIVLESSNSACEKNEKKKPAK